MRIAGERMTNRPVQHRIASLAVAAVRREWNVQGHAVDEIHEDYGEDLLVQICFEERMDPARVWVQVKGTERECSAGRLPSVRVKAGQILRWARTADLVIVVLWDVKGNRGWFTLPQGQFDHVELADRHGANRSLQFSRELPFDQAAVATLAWAARIEHANRSLVYGRSGLEEALEMEIDASVDFYKGVLASLIFDFSVSAQIVKPSGGFTEDFPHVVMEHLKQESPENLDEATRKAMIRAVFEMIELNCAGNGAPLPLVKEICATLYPLLFTEEMMGLLDAARITHLGARQGVDGGGSL
ncbi:MAG: hypothetical protein JWN15_3344 [Firmicutes bacterium]|nr:hypothetical protein [Bacillota bacterium]